MAAINTAQIGMISFVFPQFPKWPFVLSSAITLVVAMFFPLVMAVFFLASAVMNAVSIPIHLRT